MNNAALVDELVSINSIYGEDTLVLHDSLEQVCVLTLPVSAGISIRIQFPTDYPDGEPPRILGIQSMGGDMAKGSGGKVVATVQDVMAQVWRVGEPCVFELLEEVSLLVDELIKSNTRQQDHEEDVKQGGNSSNNAFSSVQISKSPSQLVGEQEDQSLGLTQVPSWHTAEAIVEKKSVFLGRCCTVNSLEEAKAYVHHLLSSDRKVARATHNIVAWRIQDQSKGTTYQDCDDDGETAAGGRLLHLLQLMNVWNVMVIVTRWYGGVLLGPDRFRLINSAARAALDVSGFLDQRQVQQQRVKGKR